MSLTIFCDEALIEQTSFLRDSSFVLERDAIVLSACDVQYPKAKPHRRAASDLNGAARVQRKRQIQKRREISEDSCRTRTAACEICEQNTENDREKQGSKLP
jgi:hypothetical protein